MKTNITLCFLLIATLLVASNCLNLHKKLSQHNIQQYKKHLVQKYLSHNFASLSHKLSIFNHEEDPTNSLPETLPNLDESQKK